MAEARAMRAQFACKLAYLACVLLRACIALFAYSRYRYTYRYTYRVARKSPIDFALLLQGYESSDKLFFFDQNFSMRLKITKKSFLFNFSTIGLHHSLQPLEAFILYCTLTVKLLVELYQ